MNLQVWSVPKIYEKTSTYGIGYLFGEVFSSCSEHNKIFRGIKGLKIHLSKVELREKNKD